VFGLKVANVNAAVAGVEYGRESRVYQVFYTCFLCHFSILQYQPCRCERDFTSAARRHRSPRASSALVHSLSEISRGRRTPESTKAP
jgi:hypothetical protein